VSRSTILLVDDDADFLRVLRRRCESAGFEVEQTCNLLSATLLIEKRVPDVVCVDVQMPTGNGLAFCEALSADEATARVPLVVLTGETGNAVRQECRRLAAHYVQKSANFWPVLEPILRHLSSDSTAKRATFVHGAAAPRQPHPCPRPPVGIPSCPREIGGKQDLVADDDDDMLQMLSQRCSSLGYSVIGVNNALDAINVIHRVMPDLVCLDVCMPSGSGLSVCEMMAADEGLRKIPVIILTGRGDESTIRRCHDLLVYYVQKSADTWQRIEPLMRELLQIDAAPANGKEQLE
jgi:CheY-like chemotaxis protein